MVLEQPKRHLLLEVRSCVEEVGLLRDLRHEHIVGYVGSAVVDRYLVIALELMPGGSLTHVIGHFGAAPNGTAKRSNIL